MSEPVGHDASSAGLKPEFETWARAHQHKYVIIFANLPGGMRAIKGSMMVCEDREITLSTVIPAWGPPRHILRKHIDHYIEADGETTGDRCENLFPDYQFDGWGLNRERKPRRAV